MAASANGDGAPEHDHLQRQVERGSLFLHSALSASAERVSAAEEALYGLLNAVVGKGLVSPEELGAATEQARAALAERQGPRGPGLALRVDDPDDDEEPAPVNCAERLPVCKAACCRLAFALSAEEVEAGTVKWDLGSPYFIRQEERGYCTHNDPATGICRIYADRPKVCRAYSCVDDPRIWKDFDNMVLNDEYLDNHLGRHEARLVRAEQMLPIVAKA